MRQSQEAGRAFWVVLVLALLAVAGVAGWYFLIYMRSPQYALNQFLRGAKADDEKTTNEWLDASGMGISQLAVMAPQVSTTSLIYPGFKGQSISSWLGLESEKVVKATVGSWEVQSKEAKVKIKLELRRPSGKSRTVQPQYILRKNSEGKWLIVVEATFLGSVREFFPPDAQQAFRRTFQRTIRQMVGRNPALGPIIQQQINSLLSQYPQLKFLFEP